MKLISMTDFILEQNNNIDRTNHEILQLLVDYAIFLKQPLNLGMFITCDEDGNVLNKPIFDELQPINEMDAIYDEYKAAQKRVLFKDFFLKNDCLETFEIKIFKIDELSNHTIEDLVECNLTLTNHAIEVVGL
jgi:hypothetical protein